MLNAYYKSGITLGTLYMLSLMSQQAAPDPSVNKQLGQMLAQDQPESQVRMFRLVGFSRGCSRKAKVPGGIEQNCWAAANKRWGNKLRLGGKSERWRLRWRAQRKPCLRRMTRQGYSVLIKYQSSFRDSYVNDDTELESPHRGFLSL